MGGKALITFVSLISFAGFLQRLPDSTSWIKSHCYIFGKLATLKGIWGRRCKKRVSMMLMMMATMMMVLLLMILMITIVITMIKMIRIKAMIMMSMMMKTMMMMTTMMMILLLLIKLCMQHDWTCYDWGAVRLHHKILDPKYYERYNKWSLRKDTRLHPQVTLEFNLPHKSPRTVYAHMRARVLNIWSSDADE